MPNISDTSLARSTGQSKSFWFDLLDGWGAKDKPHQEIALYLSREHNLSDWWSQMVTVEYERARGLRDFRERSDGYAVDVSRTITASAQAAWQAWSDPAVHSQWLTTSVEIDFREGGEYRNADGDVCVYKRIIPGKLIRFTWASLHHQPGSEVTITFNPKPKGKVMIGLGHTKLASKQDSDDLREGWSWALDSLKAFLETGKGVGWEEWKGRSRRGGAKTEEPRKPVRRASLPADSQT